MGLSSGIAVLGTDTVHEVCYGSVKSCHACAGFPLDKVLSIFPTKSLAGVPLVGAGFVPPVSAVAVARAAVTAVTDPSVEAGTMDVWQIKKYESPS